MPTCTAQLMAVPGRAGCHQIGFLSIISDARQG